MTISGDYLFVTLVLMALGLMIIQMRRKEILLCFAVSMMWFSLGMWLFFSSSAPITLGEGWSDILAWVFVILTFVPWLAQMNTEIRHEAEGHSWKSWGKEPKRESSAYEDYRDKLFNKTRGGRR